MSPVFVKPEHDRLTDQRLAVAWTSCLGAPLRGRRPVRWRPGGQPAGCVDVQNAIARQRAWPKGCPPGAGHSRLGGRRRSGAPSWAPQRLRPPSTPTANISMLLKHIDGGRGGRRPRATTCALRMPSAHRSKHRFCAWLEARPLRGQASNGLHHDAEEQAGLMAG